MILILFFLLCSTLFGQTGYYENNLVFYKLKNKDIIMQSNKLRVDLEKRINRIEFKANVNFYNYNGTTVFDFKDYLPDFFESYPYGVFSQTYKDTYKLDNIYLKFSLSNVDFTIGKQQISPGTGYFLNPVDIFNQKDYTDPAYEQPGYNAFKIDYFMTLNSQLIFIFSPDSTFDFSTIFVRYKHNFSKFDVSLYLSRYYKHQLDKFFNDEYFCSKMLGLSFAGEFIGLGVWGEFAFFDPESHKNYLEYLIGFDYTFENGLYILNEFYYNSENDKKLFSFEWINYFSGAIKSPMKMLDFSYIDYPLTDLISLGISSLYSMDDNSFSIIPHFIWNIFENTELTFRFVFNSGKKRSFLSSSMGEALFCRLKYYF